MSRVHSYTRRVGTKTVKVRSFIRVQPTKKERTQEEKTVMARAASERGRKIRDAREKAIAKRYQHGKR